MEFRKFIAAAAFVPAAAFADGTEADFEAPETKQSYEDVYFDGVEIELSQDELNALKVTEEWAKKSPKKPVPAKNGGISFIYGAQPANVVCAPMQICDIELEPGELVNGVHLGDSARWMIEPAVTGGEPVQIQHLIIKPADAGLSTSLVVTTNARTYHINLKSHATKFMPQVSFIYPQQAQMKWAQLQERSRREKLRETIPQTGEYLGDLNFDYDVQGDAPWKPVRVYTDGKKTIIQMPKELSNGEAPSLLAQRGKNGEALINYRLQGDRYIVDAVLEKAILIAGVGSEQEKVTISKRAGK